MDAELKSVLEQLVLSTRYRRFAEAESMFTDLLSRPSPSPWVSYLYGCHRLSQGDYENGWRFFEQRLGLPHYTGQVAAQFVEPRWDGRPAPDKILFLHMDQGIGDAIMCARWLPTVADRVGRVVLGVGGIVRDLMLAIEPRCVAITVGQTIPGFHTHLHFFSLPYVMGCRLDNLPPPARVNVPDELVGKWRRHLGDDGRLKVGLCWQGSAATQRDWHRSIPLEQWAPILGVPGVQFFGLQVGAGCEQIAGLPADLAFRNLGGELGASAVGFLESAALMNALDLVITIDSAPAHLAGTLGRPAWVLIDEPGEWRWLMDRTDSPWYPSLRLYRQRTFGEWGPPIARIAEDLALLTRDHRHFM